MSRCSRYYEGNYFDISDFGQYRLSDLVKHFARYRHMNFRGSSLMVKNLCPVPLTERSEIAGTGRAHFNTRRVTDGCGNLSPLEYFVTIELTVNGSRPV